MDDFNTPSLVKLGSFVDYRSLQGSKDTFVLINLAIKLFLQLNLARSFNEGTGDMVNKVTVVGRDHNNLLAGLDDSENSILEIENFDDTGNILVIQVCIIVLQGDSTDAAYISIGLEGSKCYPSTDEDPEPNPKSIPEPKSEPFSNPLPPPSNGVSYSTHADAVNRLKAGRNSHNRRILVV